MKKLLFLLPFLALTSSCSDNIFENDEPQPIICVVDTRAKEIVNETNNMAWDFLRQTLSDDENTILSPFSLAACMAMIDNGAAGKTEEQIRKFLGYEDFSQGDFNACFRTILSGLPEVDKSVTFSAANSFWYDKGLSPKKTFIGVLKEAYDAETFAKNFNDKNVVKEINGWCSDKTNKLIPKLIEELDAETVALILNAIYFRAAWNEKFDKSLTKSEIFHKSDGTDMKANFMHRTSEESGFDNDEISMVCLPMGKHCMFQTFFVLPKEGTTLDAAAETAQEVFANRFNYVNIWGRYVAEMSIPKFTIKSRKSLRETLSELGLQEIFEGGNYSNMFDNENVSLSDICQACYFTINEEEIKAAAVTSGEFDLTALPPSNRNLVLNLNRPFLFGVRENSSNTILFLGAIQEPVE